jgi:hypothetical protein
MYQKGHYNLIIDIIDQKQIFIDNKTEKKESLF